MTLASGKTGFTLDGMRQARQTARKLSKNRNSVKTPELILEIVDGVQWLITLNCSSG